MSEPAHNLNIEAARALACSLETETARLRSAQRKLYVVSGSFAAVVAASQNGLQALAAQIVDEGGDLQGWSA